MMIKHLGRRARIKKARDDAKYAKFWTSIFVAAFDIARDLDHPPYPPMGSRVFKQPDHATAKNVREATNKLMEGFAR